ncbi:DNA-binding response regulator [Niastella yeongjuensis]|uniref:DNA-binding response regulator n=1 Tax=Niastella yeongjuensis TaxID=354355 RepID=A0A1V9E0Z9_9BACT|nr:LytTR family DNA-binding domain-containing protein [Niastella yeongjuensis]OQP39772.1 DNA-binding response regulator [Niastella yeongjuensis]SEO04775.1 two component transcriptional regulator, LytTR family [Niastella yeongjuensis]
MNVLIIEDEIKTARELRSLVSALRHDITVLDILPTIKDSIQWFGSHPAPDLVFSDIQLADGLSFDIFKNTPVNTPVIFCTAFDEYAIRAFETNGIDYLLKPIDENRLQQALDKYDTLKDVFSPEKTGYEKKLENLLSQLSGNYKTTLLIHFQEKIIPIKTTDIACIHYTNGVTSIYTHANQKYVMPSTLDELEAMLQPDLFFRANRQFIINRQAIVNIEHYFSRRLVVRLAIPTPENIIISKVRSGELLQWLENA